MDPAKGKKKAPEESDHVPNSMALFDVCHDEELDPNILSSLTAFVSKATRSTFL